MSNPFLEKSMSSSHANERPKVETLIEKFNEMELNQDDMITKDNVVQFMKKNMSSKERYDPQFIDRMCEAIGFNEQDEIPVSDFINGYIEYEKAMNDRQRKAQDNVQKEQNNYDELEDKCREYQHENLNEDGLCENSKIVIRLHNIEMNEIIQDMKNIYMVITYRDFEKEIKFKTAEYSQKIGETIQLKPVNRSDPINIEIKTKDFNKNVKSIGKYSFTLEDQREQDEFAMKIEVPGLEDEKEILATINANILFYFSDYRYYDKQKGISEKRLDTLKDVLSKLTKIVKQMNSVYEKPQLIEQEPPKKKSELRGRGKHELDFPPPEDTNLGSNNQFIDNSASYQALPLKQTSKKKVFDTKKLLRYCAPILLGLSVIAALYNADFINGVLAVLLWCYSRDEAITSRINNAKILGIFDAVALGYNLIWFLLNMFKKSEIYEDNTLRIICLIVTIIMFVLEAILAFILFRTKKQGEK